MVLCEFAVEFQSFGAVNPQGLIISPWLVTVLVVLAFQWQLMQDKYTVQAYASDCTHLIPTSHPFSGITIIRPILL